MNIIAPGGFMFSSKYWIALASVAFFPLLFGNCAAAPSSALEPDLILHDGHIVTVDFGFSIEQAVAIKDARFVAVGNNDEIMNLAGPGTSIIDLKGKTVIPGLIDSHIHAYDYGLHITKHVMFSTGEHLTIASMLERIRKWAEKTPPGQWIYARGPYSLDFIAEGRLPNREELDTVTPDNPFIMNMQGHVGAVNSEAIRIAGINGDTPDPKNGKFMKDPKTGKLTGILYEFPAFGPFLKHIPEYSLADKLNAVRKADEVFNSLGLTTVVNLWAALDDLAVLKRLALDNELTVRWNVMLKLTPADFAGKTREEVDDKLRAIGPPIRFGNDWLKLNGVKIIYDGFVETADMHKPYMQDVFGKGWHGIKFWNKRTLKYVLLACAKNEVQVSIHVVGDAALDDVLNVMAEVDKEYPVAGRRWTLEHAGTMPTSTDIALAKRMRIIISTQQSMGWSIDESFKKSWGKKRGSYFAPNKTWLTSLGHPYLKAGSDNRPINPFIGFWAYITRKDVDGVVNHPEEALDRKDTLKLYTANGAYGMFEEKNRGSIEQGKLADLVVLDRDIMSVPVDEIKDMKPAVTIVGGKVVYKR